MRTFLLLALLIPIAAIGANQFGSANQKSLDVSVASLIATPERYDNKAVRVIGAWRYEFEGSVICLHREDLTFRLKQNCVNYSLDPKQIKATRSQLIQFNGNYVLAEGTFDARTNSINHIWRLAPWISASE